MGHIPRCMTVQARAVPTCHPAPSSLPRQAAAGTPARRFAHSSRFSLCLQVKGELVRTMAPGDLVEVTGIFLPKPYTGFRVRVQPRPRPSNTNSSPRGGAWLLCAPSNAVILSFPQGMRAGLVTNTYLEATAIRQYKKRYSEYVVTDELKERIAECAPAPALSADARCCERERARARATCPLSGNAPARVHTAWTAVAALSHHCQRLAPSVSRSSGTLTTTISTASSPSPSHQKSTATRT